MSAGTPVIAFRSGSVPEIVTSGVSGFIVNSVEEAAMAVGRVRCLSRLAVRRRFEARFTASRMARDYVGAYQALLAADGRAPANLVAAE
jgi:glycosyltransferase involved in cell wall biosynthesis